MDKASVLYLSLVNKASNKIATARNIGKEEGLAEGKLEERKQLALNMRNKGFDDNTIAQCLNISTDELKQLLNN